VRVAPSLPAYGEVELLAGLPSCLAEVTAAARGRLLRRQYAPERRVNSGRPNRVVEEQLPKVALLLGCSVARVHGPIRHSREGNVGIRRRNLQFIDSANLLVDELT